VERELRTRRRVVDSAEGEFLVGAVARMHELECRKLFEGGQGDQGHFEKVSEEEEKKLCWLGSRQLFSEELEEPSGFGASSDRHFRPGKPTE